MWLDTGNKSFGQNTTCEFWGKDPFFQATTLLDTKQHNKKAQPKAGKCPTSHSLLTDLLLLLDRCYLFRGLTVVQVLFCSLFGSCFRNASSQSSFRFFLILYAWINHRERNGRNANHAALLSSLAASLFSSTSLYVHKDRKDC